VVRDLAVVNGYGGHYYVACPPAPHATLKRSYVGNLATHEGESSRSPLRPLLVLPPIFDATIGDLSAESAVEVNELCARAGIRYGVTGGWPPLVVLRDEGVRGRLDNGRDCFVVDVSELP